MEDERKGLPSGSALERIALCPGSHALCKIIKEASPSKQMKAWAAAGDRVHFWLQGNGMLELSGKELDLAIECKRQRDVAVGMFTPDPDQVYTEERLWVKHPKTGKERFSVQFDFASRKGDMALVVDYKTGHGDTEEVAGNLQLRSAIVALNRGFLDQEIRMERFFGVIIQPAFGALPKVVEYMQDDVLVAELQLHRYLELCEKPNASLVAGARQCKFCPAIHGCPAVKGVIDEVLLFQQTCAVDAMEGGAISRMLDKCAVTDIFSAKVKDRAKTVLKSEPGAIPNYSLKPGSNMRSVSDPEGLHAALGKYVDMTKFISECVGIGVGDLEGYIKAHGQFTGKQLKTFMDEVVSPYLTTTAKAPTLERA